MTLGHGRCVATAAAFVGRRTELEAITAASVRALLEDAAERAFGDTDSERLMRAVLVRGYLDPAASHEQAAEELNLSRAAYFRRLKLASERLAEFLAG